MSEDPRLTAARALDREATIIRDAASWMSHVGHVHQAGELRLLAKELEETAQRLRSAASGAPG